ncbi:Clp protease N-terminal domain-containing protein [Streptosporangium sp. NPDC002524]|uniref:Clp protease N-terminal domain-containing protein n=1 Tax=Streptosporangium sp. NPDC002524 TaxID=3154537 RepID=UPI003330EBB3
MTAQKFTPRVERILAVASRIASEHGVVDAESGDPVIGAEHIFIAILRDRDSIPFQALQGRLSVYELLDPVLDIMRQESYSSPGDPGRRK